MKRYIHQLLFNLFPGQCVSCKGVSSRQIDLCAGCQRDFPYLRGACWHCGLSNKTGLDICTKCLNSPPVFSHCYSLFEYKKPISNLINQFKGQNQLAIGRVLSTLLAHRYKKDHVSQPDIWIPVPLHRSTMNLRGFNQANEIAQVLSRVTKTPVLQKGVSRRKKTLQQKHLTAAQRVDNMLDAFVLKLDLTGLTVGLVDDVVTTGATVTSLAQTVLDVGATDVQIVCLARTPVI